MAMGVLQKDRKIKRWGQDAHLSPIGEALRSVDRNLPLHIQEIYKKMYSEDEEMRNRLQPRRHIPKYKRKLMHKDLLADDPRMFEKIPFRATITHNLN